MGEETIVKQEQSVSTESKCPFNHKASAPSNRDWWPNQLNLQVLHQQSPLSDHAEFTLLDFNEETLAYTRTSLDDVRTIGRTRFGK